MRFLISWYGMRLKLKFGAIRGVVRGVVIFGVILGKNKTPDCESDILWWVIGYLLLNLCKWFMVYEYTCEYILNYLWTQWDYLYKNWSLLPVMLCLSCYSCCLSPLNRFFGKAAMLYTSLFVWEMMWDGIDWFGLVM